jgi:hypothetical protein
MWVWALLDLGLKRPPDQGLGSGGPLGLRAECLEGWELLESFWKVGKGFLKDLISMLPEHVICRLFCVLLKINGCSLLSLEAIVGEILKNGAMICTGG